MKVTLNTWVLEIRLLWSFLLKLCTCMHTARDASQFIKKKNNKTLSSAHGLVTFSSCCCSNFKHGWIFTFVVICEIFTISALMYICASKQTLWWSTEHGVYEFESRLTTRFSRHDNNKLVKCSVIPSEPQGRESSVEEPVTVYCKYNHRQQFC